MPTSSAHQQEPYDDDPAAAAAVAAALAVDMTTNGDGGGLMENDDLIMMSQPTEASAAGGKRKHDEIAAAETTAAATTAMNNDHHEMLLGTTGADELLPPVIPPVAAPPAAAGLLPSQVVHAHVPTATTTTITAPPLSLTIRPSPEGIPDKPKSKRINWGKSPHKERLQQILNDWFTKSGQCLDEITGTPIQDYRVYATKVGISRTTLFKYIHKDPSKRRLLRDDASSGSRGKKRLISEEEVKSIVKELKDGLKDDSTPPSRIEAVDLIMKRYDLNRQAASRQLTRHVLPMFHNEGIFLVGGDGDDDGEEDDNNGGDITDGGGKVAPTTAQQQVQLDDDGGGVSTMMETVEDNPIHQSKRSIVISGVTSGLGRALLGYFYNHGHTVAGCGRRVSEIQALKVQFPNARLSVVDVSDDKSVQLWADTICGGVSVNDDDGEESTEEVVDLVIANAGVSPETMHQTKTAWEVPREDFDETIDVNIKGVSNMIRHFVPRMLKNNAGTFVAMSSGLGRSPNPYHAAYCASKWAIEGMIKSLAMSLPDGMCAVPLAPGVVQTGMQPDGKNEGSSSSTSGNIDKWIEVAAPMILGLSRKDNGKSLSVKGFYSVRYRQSWSFPDGSGIPERVGHIF